MDVSDPGGSIERPQDVWAGGPPDSGKMEAKGKPLKPRPQGGTRPGVHMGDIRNLLVWIKKNLLKERPELFLQGDSVRPGILVLINDADWELLVSTSGALLPPTPPLTALVGKPGASHQAQIGWLDNPLSHFGLQTGATQGELDYQLQDQDSVLFISTLHGG
ncbi:hypothetical protein HPG69_016599 [Diceros bicornis minor]|uniref:Ubiquitin-related modifier 1 n=1 Tax=Diceros bicornis minor TaxID=77932 RepID=A0A7J7FKL4_DICBM|nr:hypothetical protein HPG69_016599 [Diceros bicornis minor]